jgi:enoyl-CoA hydratase/carnithine racemase
MPFSRSDDGPLAVLTLRHGDLNLFDRETMDSFVEQTLELSARPPRGLLIRAEGRVVSAGVDVRVFDDLEPENAADLWRGLLEAIQRIEELACPTVFAAHGLCLTAAFEIALACDLLVAAQSARFGLVENVVGLTPSMGGPQRLAERAGTARAKELIFTGDHYDAGTLHDWNVVNRVVDDAAVDDDARALALRLAHGPTLAHAATKTIVHMQAQRGVRAADGIVPEVSGALFASADLRNAVRTFLDDGPGNATFAGS